jgi:anaerobic ribonucleoside-triphosphate reductase
MFDKIRKRDGREVVFDASKITDAIAKAGRATGEFGDDIAGRLTLQALSLAQQTIKGVPTVEGVQDIAEYVLTTSPFKATAKSYIIYRDQHSKMREIKAGIGVDLIDQYLQQLDWQVNENSNMAFSLQGLNNYISSEISKIYWLNKIYPPEVRNAHSEGDFHLHDLNILSVYCVGWDLYNLLLQGFKGAAGKIESKPAKHFRTALGQIVNFFYTLQGEAAGAQAFSNFDTLLAPFIRYDNLDYGQVKQALQEFIFNINVPTRVGFQTPFTNVTLDLKVPVFYEKQGVIIGGKIKDAVYGDFQKEMDMFNKAFVEVMTEGDAMGRVFTFPIPTYNITSDFEWDNPDLDGLWKMTAKYGVPYFSNFINSDMKPEDSRSMCCRLRIDNRDLQKRGGGLFGSNPLTGSIGVVTINLPRLGYLSKDKDEFKAHLRKLIEIASVSLEMKRKILEMYTDGNLYPYTKFYLNDIKERFGEYWKNHFSTIGILGMNEACLNLIGKNIASKEGMAFALEISDFIRNELVTLQETTGNNYNFEATPAEGTSYRLAKMDKKKFSDIICANEDAYKNGHEPFYTNSTQLPVNYTDDIFEAFDLQDEIQTKYTGGTVLHIYAGEQVNEPVVIRELVKKLCTSYHLPYFTFSPTFSVCQSHGYLTGQQQECPQCHSQTEVYSRVTGYLRPVQQWNNGKKEEFNLRKTFEIKKHSYSEHIEPVKSPGKETAAGAVHASVFEKMKGLSAGCSMIVV